jgi:hypothetical protein
MGAVSWSTITPTRQKVIAARTFRNAGFKIALFGLVRTQLALAFDGCGSKQAPHGEISCPEIGS